MDDRTPNKTFRLAPMSPAIFSITVLLLIIPSGFLVAAIAGARIHMAPCFIVFSLYLWVWLRFRPSSFRLGPRSLVILWPLKRREIPRDSISSVRLFDRDTLKREIGWGVRIGAGGFCGGFGWLWTTRHGIVQMYVSRTDGFAWIDRKDDRPWLLTPEEPDAFVRALSN